MVEEQRRAEEVVQTVPSALQAYLQRLHHTVLLPNRRLRYSIWFACACLLLSASVRAQTSTNVDASTNAPSAIALSDIAVQAQATAAAAGTIESDLQSDKTLATVRGSLEQMTPEIQARLDELDRIMSPSTSLETLRRLANEWYPIHDKLSAWEKLLGRRISRVNEHLNELDGLDSTWRKTRESLPKNGVPGALLAQMQDVVGRIKQVRQDVQAQQAALLVLQSRVAVQDLRVTETISSIERAQQQALTQLLVRDSPPLWSATARSPSTQELMRQGHHSYARQLAALGGYWERERERFLLHGLLFAGLCALLVWSARRIRRSAATQPGGHPPLRHAARIFEMPIATALVLSFLAASWIYRQAPRLLWAAMGAIALVPAALLVRRVLARRLLPLLYTLVIFYFLDQVRLVSAAQPLISRLLAVFEMLGATVLLGWFVVTRQLALPAEGDQVRFRKALLLGIRVSLACSALALAAIVVGYVKFGKLLGNAVLGSSYLALTLFAAFNIADGFIVALLSSGPLRKVAVVRRHQDLLQERTRRIVGAAALVLWGIYVLDAFSLRVPVFQNLQELLATRVALHAVRFTLGDVLLFCVAIWGSFVISRFLRFVLEEEVYPHIQLAPGLHYSISKIVHYAVLLFGFLIGAGLLGFPLTKLTIVAGAVGVGVGFGLQNIINNFISGIILLFERPIKLGDVIQLENAEGVVKRIGIRASVIRTVSGSELIVPNAKLISDPVTNWTFSARQRPVEIALAVAAGTDARRVLELLNGVAAADPRVTKDPPPTALFLNFSGGALNFALRAWTDATADWTQVRSDLSLAINSALTAAGIAIH